MRFKGYVVHDVRRTGFGVATVRKTDWEQCEARAGGSIMGATVGDGRRWCSHQHARSLEFSCWGLVSAWDGQPTVRSSHVEGVSSAPAPPQ
jgi:hypothetical protein